MKQMEFREEPWLIVNILTKILLHAALKFVKPYGKKVQSFKTKKDGKMKWT